MQHQLVQEDTKASARSAPWPAPAVARLRRPPADAVPVSCTVAGGNGCDLASDRFIFAEGDPEYQTNPTWGEPLAYSLPRNLRLGVKFSW